MDRDQTQHEFGLKNGSPLQMPLGFPGSARGKEPACKRRKCKRHAGSIPGSGRSPGGGSGLHFLEPGRLQSTGLQRVGHNGAAEPSTLDVSGMEPS